MCQGNFHIIQVREAVMRIKQDYEEPNNWDAIGLLMASDSLRCARVKAFKLSKRIVRVYEDPSKLAGGIT